MGVTQVSAAELAKKKRTRFPVIGVEIGWLIVASLFVGIGLMKVYQAKLSAVADVDEQLKNKQILNLNSLSSHDELLPYLEVFPNLNDRQFAARKIYEYIIGTGSGSVNRRALANVGELVKIRITKEELDAKPQLEDLRKRLAQTNDQRSINLLTLSQLARIKPILVVRSNNEFRQSFWKYGLIYFAGFYLVSFIWLWRSIRVDRFLLPAVHLVTGVGLMLMLSLRDPLRDMMIYNDFSIGVATGFVLMLLASLVNYERVTLKNLSWVPLAFSFVLAFVLLLVGSGPSGSDAKVNLGPFQPVEFIKILLVLFLAGYFAERWEYLRNLKERSSHFAGLLNRLNIPRLKYTLPVFIGMAIALVFFFLQKDMGPALVMAVLFLTLYCVARKRPLMAILGIAVMVSGFYAGYRLGAPKTVVNRVNMWLSPWNNVARGGDQLAQSMWGLASGGGTGAGLGIGDPSVMPAAHTDLIISTVGEEMGFLGMLLVLGLYALLVYRCLRICMNATGEYSFFLGLGLTTLIAFEIILIAGGILGILPLSGIVNPFLSYGKTSMWANLLIIGILVSISAHSGAIVKEQSIATVPFARPVKVLTWGLSAVAVLFVVWAAYVQVYAADEIMIRGALALQADDKLRYQYNPRLLAVARQIARGTIYDRNGIPLATSNWQELEANRKRYLELGIDLNQACSRSSSRHYPFGGITYYLLGDFLTRKNWAASNTFFEERDSNSRLRGFDDHAKIEELTDPRNNQLVRVLKQDFRELIPLLRYRGNPDHEEVKRILSRNRNVKMSIDIGLQLRVSKILEKVTSGTHKEGEAEQGAIAVIDPSSGDLLACVSYPWKTSTITPEDSTDNEFADEANANLFDRARWGLFPPGSTFKLVTAIAALKMSGEYMNKPFACIRLSDGRVGNSVSGWGRPIRDDIGDSVPHGSVTLERGLIHSCNAYFAQIGVDMGAQALRQTAGLFNISVATPDTAEQLRDALPQAAYGQGQVVATPFQIARVSATIANSGNMPYGRWVTDDSNPRSRQPISVLSRNQAAILAGFMRRVVTEGTAKSLARLSVAIAGKTGTAEIEERKPDGRVKDYSHSWFTGFAPYDAADKRIAFCVLIEKGGYGGKLAAGAAGEVVLAARDLHIIR